MTVFSNDRGRQMHAPRRMRTSAVAVLAVAFALALTGCGETGTSGATDGASEETTPSVSYGMAGAPKDVMVSRAAMESTPTAPVLDTPESAVSSYLDWISYGYRTAQPRFAEPTMTEAEMVRVDAYNEYNIQKDRIINQTLDSITFGEIKVTSTSATVATKEEWTYWYVSITEPDTTLAGPFKAEYDAVYTVVKSDAGWVVDSLDAERLGESE
ncbi:MAG: hypothetical protein ACYC2X_11120 [Coriobacteriia bacterium]